MRSRKRLVTAFFAVAMIRSLSPSWSLADEPIDYPITPVAFTDVDVADGLWLRRIETNRQVTIPYDFRKCEETGRIANFEIAAGLSEGKHEGFWFNDSDVFKVIEGAAYSLALHADGRWAGPRPSSDANALLAEAPYEVAGHVLADIALTTDGWRPFGGREVVVRADLRDAFDEAPADPGVGGVDLPSLGRRLALTLEQRF